MRQQISYDDKLNDATYDALKAFQLNTVNSDTSDLANSKLRDIEASVNVFFNAIADNFNMVGYNKNILNDYVPALVYTMYDGYYIYSPYTNTLDDTNMNIIEGEEKGSDKEVLEEGKDYATYKPDEKISGIKPYIYYSCRYKKGDDDFVITYSLDNYITIQGKIKGQPVSDSGYLLDNINGSGNNISYRGIPIKNDQKMQRQVIYNQKKNRLEEFEYIKLNGVKYYKDSNECFSILNGERYYQGTIDAANNTNSAIEYYKDAQEFTNRVINQYGLGDLESTHAVDEEGNKLDVKIKPYKIFERKSAQSIEDPDSNFNQQRLEVIRYSIEKNLSIAIANYNNYSGVTADFQMPKLKEDEWDKVVNNISVISFLQGLNIGGKIYNGCSIITNSKNQEVVKEDSIYIVTGNGEYHRANSNDLIEKDNIVEGVLDIDFERKSYSGNNGQTEYYYPKPNIMASYTSIVNQTNVNPTDNFYQYMSQTGKAGKNNPNLASTYFTALGRERYGMYRINNDSAKMKEKFGIIN